MNKKLIYKKHNNVLAIEKSQLCCDSLINKFETLLFLTPNPDRKGEGGLRTKGLFKFNYRKVRSKKLEVRNDLKRKDKNVNDSECVWYICDYYGNLLIPVPSSHLSLLTSHLSPLTFSPLTSFPLITIITVVFNGAKYLEDTIKSVINQTYPNIEYIIIDGGSTDGTLDVIKKYEDYIDYWVSEPDNGIYDAMNKGLELAGGEWVNFMNCGDSFYSNNILNEITDILQRDDIDFIYGDTLVEYIEEKKFEVLIKAGDYRNLYRGIQFCHQSSLIKTRVHKRIKYRLDVLASDYAFFYECYLSGCKFFKVDKVISKFQSSGFSEKNELKSLCSTFSWSFKNTVNIFKKVFIFLNFTFKLIYIILKKPVKKILPLKIRKGITYLKARLINLLRC
jgi:glycosyltransferase involved in cell wall biosynthesis